MQIRQRQLLIGSLIIVMALGVAYWIMQPQVATDWALFKALAILLILAFTELVRIRVRRR